MKLIKITGISIGLPILTVSLLYLIGVEATITQVQAALALYLAAAREAV